MCGGEGAFEEMEIDAHVLYADEGCPHGEIYEAQSPVLGQYHVGRGQVPMAYPGVMQSGDGRPDHPAYLFGVFRTFVEVFFHGGASDGLHRDAAFDRVDIIDHRGTDPSGPGLPDEPSLRPYAVGTDPAVQFRYAVSLRRADLHDRIPAEVTGPVYFPLGPFRDRFSAEFHVFTWRLPIKGLMNTGDIDPAVKRIPVGCRLLDSMLGGGIESGSVTLFYGEAGCGKTNICMQMAYNVVRAGKKVAYVDTEGLSYDRILQIFKDESLVKQLLVFQVHSFSEQSQRVDQIAKIAKTGVLGLIVVDSMTMFYRLNYDNMELRNDFIRQTEVLLNLARDYDVPVLITSQVYTNITTGSIEFLGGHAMHHNAKTIIRLDMRGNGIRNAVVIKHRSLPEGRSATFRITEDGIRDP